MKSIQNKLGFLGAVWAVLSLVSCGGSTKDAAGLEGEAACDAMNAKPGESVSCSAKGFEDGCTLFLGNTPVEAVFDAESGKVTFDVPQAPAGFVDILYGCGADEPQTIQKKFRILPYFEGEGDSGDDDGEVILPEGPEAPAPEQPDEGTATPGKDLVMGGELSAGPGAGPGAAVSLAGTGDVHETNLKMIRVHWKVSGDVQEASIHATFNRFSTDGSEGDPCGKIGGRYLAVNDDGNNFNEGSADSEAAAPYLTGQLCHNNADCPEMAKPHRLPLPQETPQRLPLPKAPVCRIDLKTNFIDKGVGEGAFLTLSHQKEMRIVLVAKTQDGTVVSDERTWKAPRPVFGDVTFKVLEADRKVSFNIPYEGAITSPRLYGCVNEHLVSEIHNQNGTGVYSATCAMRTVGQKIDVVLFGVGYGNTRKKTYEVPALQGLDVASLPPNILPKDFELTLTEGGGGMEHPDGSEVASGTCNRSDIRIFHFFNWEGENVETVKVDGAGIDLDHSQRPEGKDGFDAGYLKIYEDLGDQDGTWDAELQFTIRVTFRDGTQESKVWTVDGWSCR